MDFRLHGLIPATHTPFHEDGTLAPEVVAVQAGYLAACGFDTVFVTGSTGEWALLTEWERLTIYQAWSEAGPAHGLRVVAHVGDNCLESAQRYAAAAASHGFAAVSALAPSYFKPATIGDLVDWCAAIARSAPELPFYYYDIPGMTGVSFDPEEFLVHAAAKIPNLAGIKFTNPDVDAFRRCLEFGGGRYDIPWGIDERLAEGLAAGAKGAVGSSYNFAPGLYREIIRRHQERGPCGEVERLQGESRRLIEIMAAAGYFGASKVVMEWLGVPLGPARAPLANPDAEQLAELRELLSGFSWLGPDSQRGADGAGPRARLAEG